VLLVVIGIRNRITHDFINKIDVHKIAIVIETNLLKETNVIVDFLIREGFFLAINPPEVLVLGEFSTKPFERLNLLVSELRWHPLLQPMLLIRSSRARSSFAQALVLPEPVKGLRRERLPALGNPLIGMARPRTTFNPHGFMTGATDQHSIRFRPRGQFNLFEHATMRKDNGDRYSLAESVVASTSDGKLVRQTEQQRPWRAHLGCSSCVLLAPQQPPDRRRMHFE
jgi:hypothetical protein